MPSSFVELLEKLVARYGSQRAAARAIGISSTRFNRALNGVGYAFKAVNCYKLARLIDAEPIDVLRAAGLTELAHEIHEAHGPQALTATERKVLAAFRAVGKPEQTAIETLLTAGARRRKS